VDELSFGSRREPRRLPPRLRAFAVAAVIAGAAAAGVGVAPPPASQAAGLPAPVGGAPVLNCAPVDITWPNLTDLPVQLRTRARSIVINEQFSGRCTGR
jgi:hypothetical protein